MELFAGIVGVADVTARTSAGLWRLCEHWRDAPKDVSLLRDDLGQASEFFAQLQRGIAAEQARAGASTWPPESIAELERMLQDGEALVLSVQQLVDDLLNQTVPGAGQAQQDLSKRRKLTWVKRSRWVLEQRRALKKLVGKIYGVLLSLNV